MRFLLSLLVGFIALTAPVASLRAGLPPPLAEGGLPTLAPVLEQVTPAVVNIAVLTSAVRTPPPGDPRRLFGGPERRPQVSAGSGVIVDAQKGWVLTNHHVIKDAQQIAITLKDGRRLVAQLQGSDAGTDIALLVVDPAALAGVPALRFSDSDVLRVGDYVLAIGNPFGLGQTVTSGIVSALGRTGLNIEGYEDFVQTDASINPGNSGGALVNLRGELVGINTAIIGPAGGNVGIGFAVPSNMARAVMLQLGRHGEMRRGRLGLTTQDLTHDLAAGMGLHAGEGALVVEVAPGSPAEKAGIRRGDAVVTINGHHVRSSSDLRNQIGLVPVGEEADMRIRRGSQDLAVRARIAAVQAPTGARGSAVVPELAGASVGNLERDGRAEAVIIVGVQRGSAAWAHGLREGDIILAVNGSKMHSTREFLQALREEGNLVLTVARGDYSFAIVVRRG